MNKTRVKSENENDTIPCGLIIHGTILKRSRRHIETKNEDQVEIVTYVIEGDEKRKYFIEDYAPDRYYDVGKLVSIPVYVKPYTKKTGALSYTLNVQKEYSYSSGEDF